MANLTPGSNENIYQLLSQHNFTFIDKKIDDYKCIICHRILTNAHKSICGCHYCEKCVDEQMRSSVVFCPGDTEDCKTAALSNVFPDPKTNKQILQLVVKCPEEMCCYESQLRNMGDHLRLCGKRVECPFTDFGCDQGKLERDELNEHLQQESYRHIKKLTGVICNLRNELAELKRDREKCNAAIENLVKSDKEKAVIIDSMKLEKAVLEQRVNNLGNILDGKADKMVAEIEAKLEEMRREWRGAMEQQQLALANVEEKIEVKSRTEIPKGINSVGKCLPEKFFPDFVWTIDNLAVKRQKGGWAQSEYFYECAEPYKLRLDCDYNCRSTWRLYFNVPPSNSDEYLHWPYDRNVTIAITNQNRPEARKVTTIHYSITYPSHRNSYIGLFEYKWNELTIEGLLHGDHLTVQCFIRRR